MNERNETAQSKATIRRDNVRRMATEYFNERLRESLKNSAAMNKLTVETQTEHFIMALTSIYELGFKEAQGIYLE